MQQLERYLPFSQSRMWGLMRDYYINSGMSAWTGEVPFYVTSHPFMAHRYANLIVDAWRDWRAQSSDHHQVCFYVIELGAGTGKLSYHILRALEELCAHWELPFAQLRYVMTDLVEANVDFWKQHKQLASFVKQGVCDFATLDCESFTSVLCASGDVIAASSLNGPLCVIGNYIFDTLPADIFQKKNGHLYESRVSAFTESSNLEGDVIKECSRVTLEHEEARLTLPYYNDVCDVCLERQLEFGEDGFFFVPTVAIRALHTLASFSSGRLILLTSDKGYRSRSEMLDLSFPKLTFHGSFSVMVNYLAIADYIESQAHGFTALQEPRAGIASCVMSMGMAVNRMPNFLLRVKQDMLDYSSGDYFTLYRAMVDSKEHQSADTLIALLAHSRWDPHVLQRVYQRLGEALSSGSESSRSWLRVHLADFVVNRYDMPGAQDTFFALGFLAYCLGDYQSSLDYYTQSLHLFPKQSSTHFNMGLSWHYLGDNDQARDAFQTALALDADNAEAKEWLAKLSA